MATKGCITRLQKEYKALQREPVPHLAAHPTSNLLEWHFVLEGAAGTDYEGGVYHGRLVFPPNYPFKPPSILMVTPNGRFATNTKLCLSITDYHPESWNPMWSVGTILTGLLSFMYDSQPTTGSITTSRGDKVRAAVSCCVGLACVCVRVCVCVCA
ncbi:MAG: ubiquitin-conjugating enzyme/RWD-like protein [Monoraphidium minutum]|nr:MAG: ubiquitin-conjugating enzyme/RWD-like protein [Monoraphidium minutum]